MKLLRKVLIVALLAVASVAMYLLFTARGHAPGDVIVGLIAAALILLVLFIVLRVFRRWRSRRRVRGLIQVEDQDSGPGIRTALMSRLFGGPETRMLRAAYKQIRSAWPAASDTAADSIPIQLHIGGYADAEFFPAAGFEALTSGDAEDGNAWFVSDRGIHVDFGGASRHSTDAAPASGQSAMASARMHNWKRLIQALRRNRPNDPVQGIVVSLDAGELDPRVQGDTGFESAEVLGSMIVAACRMTGMRIPVHVRIVNAERIPGLEAWAATLSEDALSHALVHECTDGLQSGAQSVRLFSELVDRVEYSSRIAFVESASAEVLSFGRNLQAREPAYRAFCNALDAAADRHWRTRICSLSLTGRAVGLPDTSGYLFNRHYLRRYLPSRVGLRQLNPIALRAHQSRQWAVCALLLLCSGALLATAATRHVAASEHLEAALVAFADVLMTAPDATYGLEQSARALSMIDDVQAYLREQPLPWISGWTAARRPDLLRSMDMHWLRYTRQHVIAPLEEDAAAAFRGAFASGTPDTMEMGEVTLSLLERIAWTERVLQRGQARESGPYSSMNGELPPDLEWAGDVDAAQFAELYGVWVIRSARKAPDQLDRHVRELQDRFVTDIQPHVSDFEWVIDYINREHPDAGLRLRHFWSGTGSYPDAPVIDPAFTETGFAVANEILDRMLAAHPDPDVAGEHRQRFLSWYADEYVAAWDTFIRNFDTGEQALRGRAEWQVEVSLLGTVRNPYTRLLAELAVHMAPIIDADEANPPEWVDQAIYYHAVLDYIDEAGSAGENTLTRAVQSGSGIRDRLTALLPASISRHFSRSGRDRFDEQSTSAGRMRTAVERDDLFDDAVDVIEAYRASIVDTAFQIGGASTAYNDMESLFRNADDPAEGSGNLAALYELLRDFERVVGRQDENSEAAWRIIAGPVRLLRNYLLRDSGCYVQSRWQEDVLSELDSFPAYRRTEALLGDGGLLWDFVDQTLEPFVRRSGSGYSMRSADGVRMPFLADFTQFLSQARDNVPRTRESYEVRVHSRPTGVNTGASVHPRGNTVRLSCASGDQEMSGRNFNRDSVFTWTEGCTDVNVIIQIGPHALTQSFRGREGFRRFIETYREGPRLLEPQDFDGRVPVNLAESGVQQIRVEFDFENYHQFLADMRTAPVEPPDRASVCW